MKVIHILRNIPIQEFPHYLESILLAKFAQRKDCICESLLDVEKLHNIIQTWELANPELCSDRRVALSVDAVFFRSSIAGTKNGKIEGLAGLPSLESHDIFTQFVSQPETFFSFLQDHWDEAYSAIFAFQIQLLHPESLCLVIHVVPATTGKGNETVVNKFISLGHRLQDDFGFHLAGLAFDGNSCFNSLHMDFERQWMSRIGRERIIIPLARQGCDPERLFARSKSQ
jgi:hypothetical protein